MQPEKLLTIPEAADLLQVKPGTLYSWVSKKAIPYRKVGALVRFEYSELMEWTQGKVEPRQHARPRRAKLSVVK